MMCLPFFLVLCPVTLFSLFRFLLSFAIASKHLSHIARSSTDITMSAKHFVGKRGERKMTNFLSCRLSPVPSAPSCHSLPSPWLWGREQKRTSRRRRKGERGRDNNLSSETR